MKEPSNQTDIFREAFVKAYDSIIPIFTEFNGSDIRCHKDTCIKQVLTGTNNYLSILSRLCNGYGMFVKDHVEEQEKLSKRTEVFITFLGTFLTELTERVELEEYELDAFYLAPRRFTSILDVLPQDNWFRKEERKRIDRIRKCVDNYISRFIKHQGFGEEYYNLVRDKKLDAYICINSDKELFIFDGAPSNIERIRGRIQYQLQINTEYSIKWRDERGLLFKRDFERYTRDPRNLNKAGLSKFHIIPRGITASFYHRFLNNFNRYYEYLDRMFGLTPDAYKEAW